VEVFSDVVGLEQGSAGVVEVLSVPGSAEVCWRVFGEGVMRSLPGLSGVVYGVEGFLSGWVWVCVWL
jgi:hypothetical protein